MKRYTAQVYTPAGALITRWGDAPLPRFSAAVNSGYSDMDLDLPRRLGAAGLIDEAGLHDVALGNRVEYRVIDVDTIQAEAYYGGNTVYGGGARYGVIPGAGALVYRGIIEEIAPEIGPDREQVSVKLSSPSKQIGTAYVTSFTTNPLDAAVAARQIVAQFAPALTWHPLNPRSAGISNFALTFTNVRLTDALEALRLLAGLNWYWAVYPDGSVRFAQSNLATPDHTFVVGQHVESFKPTVSRYRTKTQVHAFGASGLHSVATAADYVASDPRIETLTLPQVNQQSVLDAAAATRLLELDRIAWRAEATIYDNNVEPGSLPAGVSRGYDLESIYPGQTCRFVYGTSAAPAIYGSGVTYGSGTSYGSTQQSGARAVFVIQSVTYELDRVRLELGERQASLPRKVAALQNNLIQRLTAA